MEPEFFASRAHLEVLRADWHFIHRWDALVEVRISNCRTRRTAAAASGGDFTAIGDHIKVGVGYNFSDFSDDLTQLDYRYQGFFINLVGKF